MISTASCTSVESIQLETRRDDNHHDRLGKMNLVIKLGPLEISIGNRLRGSCPVRGKENEKLNNLQSLVPDSSLEIILKKIYLQCRRDLKKTSLYRRIPSFDFQDCSECLATFICDMILTCESSG